MKAYGMPNGGLSHSAYRSLAKRFGAIGFALALFPFALQAQNSSRQFLKGHVPASVSRLRLQPLGGLPATQWLNLAIGLPLRNQQTLGILLQQICDPTSPNYRHYPTPEQFTEEFGPTEQDYLALIAFLEAKGLEVTCRHSNRVVLDVSGQVVDVEKALHLTLHIYQHPAEARTFYAPAIEPSLDLAIPILHVSGLDNFAIPRPVSLKAQSAGQAAGSRPNSGSGPGGAYIGNDFRAAYAPSVRLKGSGQIVGLLEFDGYYPNDIINYETRAGLPNVTLRNVPIDGGISTPGYGNGEVSLDIEMAIAMAPGVSEVIVYEAPNPSPWEDMLSRMANDNLAKQLSSSWYIPGGGPNPTADQIFQQMAAQGQTFFESSGDADAYTGSIDFPSDNPFVTLVGGTTLGPAGSASKGRGYHTATLLPNGQVLVAGGVGGGDILSSAQLYDPATGGWTPTGALNSTRGWHNAILLPNGQVLVVGGGSQNAILSTAELYDPVTGTWTPTGAMNDARESSTATLLPNGQVLVAGGEGAGLAGILSSAELYDPATETWTPTGSMIEASYFQTATLLTNGQVLVAGGSGGGGQPYSGEELYDPATGTWTPTGSLNIGRVLHTATLLTNGLVLVAGGFSGGTFLTNAELYDPMAGTWTPTGSLKTGRQSHTATLLANGLVLVAGGYREVPHTDIILSSGELYNPVTGTWTPTGSMATGRWDYTATLLTNGQVLAVGSWLDGILDAPTLSSADLYTPATGTWTNTGAMGGAIGSWLETAWNQADGTGSGGGISTYYTIPTWQQGINMVTNGGSTAMRNVPDVAMVAQNVYVTYNNGQSGPFWGTSCSAPLWAGFMALVNQQAAAAGKPPVGFANPAIYAIGQGTNYLADFHDTKTGDNAWSGSPDDFDAVPGYDLCTGWGTPAGQKLIDDLSGTNIGILIITPTKGFTAIGPPGGPFGVTAQRFSLTNSGLASLAWSLSNTSSWLHASPVSGTLAGGSWTSVSVNLNPAVTNLAAGLYTASILFSNQISGDVQNYQFNLLIVVAPVFRSISISRSDYTVSLEWTAVPGFQYQIQYRTNLAQSGWANLRGAVTANNAIMKILDNFGPGPQRFYRIHWVPPN